MKCPFELPVKKLPDFEFEKNGLYRSESANGLFLSFSLKEDEVDYIVQAINGYEKLTQALEKIRDTEVRDADGDPYGALGICKNIALDVLKETEKENEI